jgi:predicted ATP-grasp superfamily ATP-dependent carboligase
MAPTEIPAAGTALTPAVPMPAASPEQPAAGYDVLVLDAATKQSLASVRSLGRAGLRVAVGECFAAGDRMSPVVAFQSRYSARNVALPSFAADASAFADSVVEFVREHRASVVLPTMDGTIAALVPRREQLRELGCRLALAPDAALEIANDKDLTLAVARSLGIDYPATMRISSLDDLPGVVAAFGYPFVLKPTVSYPRDAAERLVPVDVIDEAEAVSAIRHFQGAGAGVLAQQWACGRREGVTLFVVGREIRAACAHVAHRTSPVLGGASVLRESVPILDEIYGPAVELVTKIGLQGVCEVEFRRDAAGRPLLMEVNARLAGTIENAVQSGVDFPLMIWQWATGQPVDRVDSYQTGIRTRWLHGDMRWLYENCRRTGRPDSVPRAQALWTFAAEFARTSRYDCLDRRDLRPALAELRTTVSAIRKSRRAIPHKLNTMGQ